MRKAGDKQTLIILALAFLILLAGIVILLYPTFRPQVHSVPIGQVLWIKGKVSSRVAQSSIWFELSKKDKLYEGQWIRTGPESSISLKIGEQEHFILPPGKEIILSSRAEKRHSLIDFKVSENEANLSTDSRNTEPSQKAQAQNHSYPERLVKIANRVTPTITELHILWPKQGETFFYNDNQPIHFFWQGPSDGLFEIRILNTETGKQQSINIGNTYHFSWLPSQEHLGKMLTTQIIDKKHNLKSQLTEFLIMKAPTIVIRSPPKSAEPLIISPSQPLKIQVEPHPDLSDWRGELLFDDKRIPLLFSNNQATVPFTHVERIAKHPRSLAVIKIQATWQPSTTGQVTSVPIEESWMGQIELVPKKWWQALGEQKSVFTCDEDKKEWLCQKPIQVQLEKEVNFTAAEIVLSSGQTLSPSLDENHVISFCPAAPIGDLKYRILLKSDSKTIKYESDWLQASATIEDQPKIITAKTIKTDEGEYYNLIATRSCREISLNFRLLDEQENTIQQFSDLGSSIHVITSQKPAHVEIAYVDINGHRLSAAMKVEPTFKALTMEPKSSAGTEELSWSLKDNGKLYIQAKDTRPWTLLKWKASKKFDEYEIQISADDSFNSIIAQQITTQKSLQLILQPSWEKIYWRVRGLSVEDGPSPWSQVREITIFKLQNEKRELSPRISKPQE